jgi:hypothetical protein
VREQDVIDAVASGRWPACAADLREHVGSCRVCADLVTIVEPLLDARDCAWEESRIPSSAVVWWRAQMRARREATLSATRPLTIAQTLGVLVGIVALLTLLGLVMPWLSSFSPARDLLSIDVRRWSLPDLSELGRQWWVVLFVVGPWLILTPMAIYFAMADD